MEIKRIGDKLHIEIDVSAEVVNNGHMSSTGKNWVVDAGKLTAGPMTVQISVYQKQAPRVATVEPLAQSKLIPAVVKAA